ncbi:hypothetical protein Tco_0679841 [Tanacetum coccineum]|uniref:Uncharacterized protein n=1 Tax=Tanacetum coccineum TaxID=301880 RepID=A0ABQ4XKF9_9ASTR
MKVSSHPVFTNLTLDTLEPKKTRPSSKVSPAYVIKKKTEKSSSGSKPCSNKKTDSSTEQLLLTLIKEVKGLKRQIKIPLGTSPSSTQPSSSKASKQKTWFGPCKHYGFRNHLSDDCYSKPKCSTYGSTDHLSKEHLEHAVVKKTLIKLKAQCEVCGSSAHEAPGFPKKHPNSKRSKIANRQSKPTEKYIKELGPKVVFRYNSSGDTEGYGLVNCNGITFIRVAYVNGLKYNLISISTDKAKIIRKRSKPDKHGHGNGRAHKEPEVFYKKSAVVNPQSTLGQSHNKTKIPKLPNSPS